MNSPAPEGAARATLTTENRDWIVEHATEFATSTNPIIRDLANSVLDYEHTLRASLGGEPTPPVSRTEIASIAQAHLSLDALLQKAEDWATEQGDGDWSIRFANARPLLEHIYYADVVPPRTAPAGAGTPPGVAIVQLHEALSWVLDILEMNDTRLIQLGDPDYLVRSPIHLAGIAKARAALTAHDPSQSAPLSGGTPLDASVVGSTVREEAPDTLWNIPITCPNCGQRWTEDHAIPSAPLSGESREAVVYHIIDEGGAVHESHGANDQEYAEDHALEMTARQRRVFRVRPLYAGEAYVPVPVPRAPTPDPTT